MQPLASISLAKPAADPGYLPLLDGHIGFVSGNTSPVYDGTTTNYQVIFGHYPPLYLTIRRYLKKQWDIGIVR